MFVHMGQILCCPVTWIIELRSISPLLQALSLWPLRRGVFCFHLIYIQRLRTPNICLETHGASWTLGWEPLNWRNASK